jgi:hypothetical protein
MATDRIDRQIEGLERLPPRTEPPAPHALKEIKPAGKAAVADPLPPDDTAYIEPDAPAGDADQPTVTSPSQYIAEFVEPLISNPEIFRGGRPRSILERLASDIIPQLGGNEELRSLACSLIEDEIDLHCQLAAHIHSGIIL